MTMDYCLDKTTAVKVMYFGLGFFAAHQLISMSSQLKKNESFISTVKDYLNLKAVFHPDTTNGFF